MYRLLILPMMMLCISFAHAQKSVTGSDILMPFKKNLQQALLSGLTDRPEQAIKVAL